jgi:hypothetical protein
MGRDSVPRQRGPLPPWRGPKPVFVMDDEGATVGLFERLQRQRGCEDHTGTDSDAALAIFRQRLDSGAPIEFVITLRRSAPRSAFLWL